MSLRRLFSFSSAALRVCPQIPAHTYTRRVSSMSSGVAAVLSVRPVRGMVDEAFQVLVENLPSAFPVTLHALHQSEDRDYWEAYGHYVSDHRGSVSVSEDMSFGGTYVGKEAMGLVWSLRPVPGSRPALRLRKMNVCSPMLLAVSVYGGHVAEGFREQVPLASVLMERWYMAPGVQRIDVKEKRVKGTLFIPAEMKRGGLFPGLLDMWGGGGGLVEYRAALLASHGFVTMALEYIGTGDLSSADMELSYFEMAFDLIRSHPQVMKDRVGIFGLSLGTLMTLNMAAYSNVINPRCCVCVSGSHVQFLDHPTTKTVGEMMARNLNKVRMDEQNQVIWRDIILPLPTDLSQKVDVGKIKCPLLLVNGNDDQNWATVESAEDINQMMHVAGNEHLLTTLTYPGAGHLIEPPYSPHIRASNFTLYGKKVVVLWGGKTKPHSDAQEDAWKKILAFLQQHLHSSPQAKL
ncbi:hypothetical protein LDENG_00185930 [Lucifuga dentata]|nr:hypothetical protein LDENG_00185930 [Lucifuga dentata]